MDSTQWDSRYREKELVWSAGPNRFLVEQLKGMKPARALDLACGEGRNAIWLAEQGWTVTASDFSPIAIEKAKARCSELKLDVDLRVADATQALDAQYDLIVIFYLHLPRDQNAQLLKEALKGLAPGGTLLYVGHDERNIKEGIGGPQDASILYAPAEIQALLSELKIEQAETIERPVEKEGVTHQALDILVRAKRNAA